MTVYPFELVILAVVFALVIGGAIGAGVVHFLAAFKGRRRRGPDWLDPDNAPPAFANTRGHEYQASDSAPCCVVCGGGSKHRIHTGAVVAWDPAADRAFDNERQLAETLERGPAAPPADGGKLPGF